MIHLPISQMIRSMLLVTFSLASASSLNAWASDGAADNTSAARAWFSAATQYQCRTLDEIDALFQSEDEQYPIRHVVDATDHQGNVKADKAKTVIFEFFCDSGAYNARHIFVSDEDGFFQQLAFSQPAISVEYENDSPESAVKSVAVTGFVARMTVTNPEFDAETGKLKESAFWRGVGDAASEVWWDFRGDRFVLSRFRVDASYDGEINPSHDFSWSAKEK